MMEEEEIDYESVIQGEREGNPESGENEDECMSVIWHTLLIY